MKFQNATICPSPNYNFFAASDEGKNIYIWKGFKNNPIIVTYYSDIDINRYFFTNYIYLTEQ
jgi:hypothetical protein